MLLMIICVTVFSHGVGWRLGSAGLICPSTLRASPFPHGLSKGLFPAGKLTYTEARDSSEYKSCLRSQGSGLDPAVDSTRCYCKSQTTALNQTVGYITGNLLMRLQRQREILPFLYTTKQCITYLLSRFMVTCPQVRGLDYTIPLL